MIAIHRLVRKEDALRLMHAKKETAEAHVKGGHSDGAGKTKSPETHVNKARVFSLKARV